jgi:hypothetical protein
MVIGAAGGTVDTTGASGLVGFSGSGAGATVNGNTTWTDGGRITSGDGVTDLTIAPAATVTDGIPLSSRFGQPFRVAGGGTLYVTAPPNSTAALYVVSHGRLRADDLSATAGASVLGAATPAS